MKLLVNVVALNEASARYYMKRGGYVAAANVRQYALKEYPQLPPRKRRVIHHDESVRLRWV